MSETQNQSNSNPTNPITSNSNPAQNENPEPTSAALATSPQPQPAQTTNTTPKVAFHSSAVHRPTAQTKDYFAEQNQQTQAKKQVNSKKIKLSLIIIGSILGVMVVGGLIWFIFANLNILPTADDKPYDEMTEEEQSEYNYTIAQGVYDSIRDKEQGSTNTDSDPNTTTNTAKEDFQQAIESAPNNTEANVIRVSEMRYLLESGEYTDILEVGTSVCEDTNLDLMTRLSCANIMALAAHKKGNQELYNYYNNLQMTLTDEATQLNGLGGA